MGVIDLYSLSSHCVFKTHQRHRSIASFEENRMFVCSTGSSIPVKHKPSQQRLAGDDFIRPHLRKLSPYQPILPFEVLSAHLGRKPEEIVKMDANENPYGPPPEVLEALASMKFPYVYPDPESRRLRAALAEDSGLESDYILAGCGADELIDLIMRCVLDPGDKIVDCPPTFTMYEFDAAVNGALVIKVPRQQDFSLNIEHIVEVVEQEKPKCIFLTSPNNPDGSIISDDDLLKILDLPILVVLDEAYIEFSGMESRMKWVKEALVQERERLYKVLKEVPFLKPYPSYSNFILCEVTSGKDAKKLKDDLAQMGVMIRHYSKKELKGYVRVSVGKPEHTDALMKCLKILS
uniref:histidinol-phosphate transaminase n=1 Tax=Nelumbo nucifera TaxID=4432 RepID=A0A822ZVM9_NELNU|nr:TPA_asm: hypothetical protein HUJ06_018487 [Nelumbo nucifera]